LIILQIVLTLVTFLLVFYCLEIPDKFGAYGSDLDLSRLKIQLSMLLATHNTNEEQKFLFAESNSTFSKIHNTGILVNIAFIEIFV